MNGYKMYNINCQMLIAAIAKKLHPTITKKLTIILMGKTEKSKAMRLIKI